MAQQNTTLEKAVEALVYAPVGAACFVRDTAPTFIQMFVARGRTEVGPTVKNVEAALTDAKTRGEATVAFGPMQVAADVMARLDALRARFSEAATVTAATVAHAASSVATNATSATNGDDEAAQPAGPITTTPVTRADASALPIANYDELSASQVVERLDGLDGAALEAVREYEAQTRGRRTILGRIEVLTA